MKRLLPMLLLAALLCSCTPAPDRAPESGIAPSGQEANGQPALPDGATQGLPHADSGSTAFPELEQGFFYPVRSYEELTAIACVHEFTDFRDGYDVRPFVEYKRISNVSDMLWLNGQLLVVDYDLAIYVMNSDFEYVTSILQAPGYSRFMPYAVATDGAGKLYVLMNKLKTAAGLQFSIAMFDSDLVFEKSIDFKIDIDEGDNSLYPGSLEVNPDGGFFMTFMDVTSEKSNWYNPVIYGISESGDVKAGPGNNSLGYLLNVSGSLFFANGGFQQILDKHTVNNYSPQNGISALFKLEEGEVTARAVLPVKLCTPVTEEFAASMLQAYEEILGQPAPQELIDNLNGDRPYGPYCGCRGLLRLCNDIAVLFENGDMYVFDTDLNYKYSEYIGEDREAIYRDYLSTGMPHSMKIVAACADDAGNVYIAQRFAGPGGMKYGFSKATPKS